MDFKRFDGLTVETAINQIKQKPFREIDATDFAFLKSREEYLTEADKAIYLRGENPEEVLVETTPLTREERIINENRPLQVAEERIRKARDAARRAELEAGLPLVGDAKTEAEKEEQKAREAKAKSLNAEVARLEKEEAEADKKRAAEAKVEAKKADK